MALLKKAKNEVVFKNIPSGPFADTALAEIFDTSGKTEMSCGIHEISPSVRVVEKAPVSDVLYILEGELTIEAGGVTHTYRAGDFAYLCAGHKQTFTVKKRVKHIYICYPAKWQ